MGYCDVESEGADDDFDKFVSAVGTIAWMYREGKRFHDTGGETADDTLTRKQPSLPK